MTSHDESIAAYDGVRARITELVSQAEVEDLATVVPATPAWQVRDLLAHVVGLSVDVAAGNVADAGSDPWTAAQVAARRGRSVEDLLAEWEEGRSAFTAALGSIDELRAAQVVFDACTHEHDLRGALEQPGARDSDAVRVGWTWATTILGQLLDGFERDAIALHTEDGEQVAGSGAVASTVTAPRFELFRTMTGRRSHQQVEAYEWSGEPVAEHLCLLPARSTPLVE